MTTLPFKGSMNKLWRDFTIEGAATALTLGIITCTSKKKKMESLYPENSD